MIKTNKYIIFESGDYFFDNSFAMFLYIKKKYPCLKLKYCVTNEKQLKDAQLFGISKREIIFRKNSLYIFKIYYYSLKAKLIFMSYRAYWSPYRIPRKTKIIYLSHGEFPIKDCSSLYNGIMLNSPNRFYLIFSTQYVLETVCEKNPICYKNIPVIAGMPRNDFINSCTFDKNDFLNMIGVDKKNPSIILSMTTFRNPVDDDNDFFRHEFPIELSDASLLELNEILEKNNSIYLIKVHHVQSEHKKQFKKLYSNIVFLENETLQNHKLMVQSLYLFADVMITDYSSSFISFLPFNKPIGFIQTDKDSYYRGFTIEDIDTLLPGEKIYSYEDFVNFIKSPNVNEHIWSKQRNIVREKLLGDYHGNNCESIAKIFLE